MSTVSEPGRPPISRPRWAMGPSTFFSPDFPDVPAKGAVAVSGDTIPFFSSNRCEGRAPTSGRSAPARLRS